jgi:hypothetical protein
LLLVLRIEHKVCPSCELKRLRHAVPQDDEITQAKYVELLFYFSHCTLCPFIVVCFILFPTNSLYRTVFFSAFVFDQMKYIFMDVIVMYRVDGQ